MTREETVKLCRYVRGACPQQAIDEFTPNIWHDLLGDLSLVDCRLAVEQVARRQPFVSPSEIRAEVRRIRDDRLGPTGPGLPPMPPPHNPDDVRGYLAALRQQTRAVADGRQPRPELPAGEPDDPTDNEHVRAILAAFDAERQAKRDREKADRERERRAIRAYAASQERLLALPIERRLELVKLAEEHLLNSDQAVDGFPLLDEIPGNSDREKVVVLAARLADREPS